MNLKKAITVLLLFCGTTFSYAADNNGIKHDALKKTITMTDPDENLSLVIDYSNGCRVSQIEIKGKNTLSPSGVYTGIQVGESSFSSLVHSEKLQITEKENAVKISNITYGNDSIAVTETWNFKQTENKIHWQINREYDRSIVLNEMAFPKWNFADLSVWKGGILDNGGMVWCKYLSKVNDTYGVHTGGFTLWDPVSGNALRISAEPEKKTHIATAFSHSENNEFTCTQFVTDTILKQRYHLNRFISQKPDVFAPFDVKKGAVTIDLDLEYVDYFTAYSRGTLTGIDSEAVRELLNTTGRYGVVDNNIIGANGWTTNWKCLHEPFFAQIGMAVNDKNYTANLSSTLDQERDLAMLDDGRVLSRWHNAPGDEIPGTYNPETGYYEAMWGYTIDSQTGYVINTSEQFDLCGDIHWLQSHKQSCEKALDWLIRRDSNHNGIFEMKNNTIAEQKASDWLDIVWAGFENAFVNAQLYEALHLWANCETVLRDKEKAEHYLSIAAHLKTAFNKPVEEGGFWLPEKKQYIYWRDKDGSIHGDNLVTPVNFAAIAFGLCNDPQRINQILGQIEERTQTENLFHWPLCFDSYKKEEVHNNNWPFPKYENGDIFPTWGYLGIRAYINYDKTAALNYIRNILEQYKKDGLSSQRYSRQTQLGLGDDILAGICTSVTALYRDIYGIRPKWNRMGIEPNMSSSLNGTHFHYTLRDVVYELKLSENDYWMGTDAFYIKSKHAFGANMIGSELTFFPDNKEDMTLIVSAESNRPIQLEINRWNKGDYSWNINSPDQYNYILTGLKPNSKYQLLINEKHQTTTVKKNGNLSFKTSGKSVVVLRLNKNN